MKLKLQYDTFEEGEFTEEQTVNLEDLLTVFENNTIIIKSKRSFTINKLGICFFIQNGENYLRLQHISKDSFVVSYCNDPDDKLYQANFYKKSVKEIIILFCQEKHDALCKRIPRTKEHEKKLIQLFKAKDFVYHYKHRGMINLLFITILYSSAFLVFLGLFFLQILQSITLISFLPFLLTLFFLTLIVMVYRLHFNYIKNSKAMTLQVRTGSQKVILTNESVVFEFDKTEIEEVICFQNSYSRSPFTGYSYSKILLKDNRSFNISFMIIDFGQVQNVLKGVSTRIEEKRYPFIKD